MNPNLENRLESQEHFKPTIRLEFFRHDERSKAAQVGGNVDDESIRLTQAGREHAKKVGKEKNPHPETAMVFGSPKDRTTETALRQMLSHEEGITSDMSLEEIKENINLPYGKKHSISEELNFTTNGTPEFNQEAENAYFKDKNYLSFLYEKSDSLVDKLGDKISTSYSRQAANIAKLIKKYVTILPRWQEIIKDDPEKYKAAEYELQRFLGTHGGIQECFIMKVIDKLEGKDAVKVFMQAIPNGFGFSEGMAVTIIDEGGNPNITLKYKDKTWNFGPELLEEVIKEGEK